MKVAKVNTLNMQVRRSAPAGSRWPPPSWKKAMVTLTDDSKTIEFFEGNGVRRITNNGYQDL